MGKSTIDRHLGVDKDGMRLYMPNNSSVGGFILFFKRRNPDD